MNNLKINIVAGLFMVACGPLNVLAIDQNSDNSSAPLLSSDKDTSQAGRDLREILRDKERWPILLRDRGRMRGILQQGELRQELLQHPHFIRQMMQIKDMRQELLANEQMMLEMLRNKVISREINRNPKMLEEIEKNETYRHIHQDQQDDLLKELLLEPTE